MQNQRVLISGASIAGPALAFWLGQYGFEPTIVERAPFIRAGGYAVDFRGASLRVLERMGILEEVRRFETRTGAINIVDKNNRTVASMPDGLTSGELEIMRGDLARILYEATHTRTEYLFDDSITGILDGPAGVEVTFSRSAPRRFDLVIGADGLHSNVRKLTFGAESQFIRNLGYYISIFTVPNILSLDHSGVYYSLIGKKVGLFSARKNTEAMASFFFASPPLTYDRRDIAQQKQIVREHFGHEEWEVPRLLKLMEEAPDFYFDSISQVKMDRWSQGRATLLGDAACCPSPVSGMGTSIAMVGAYILAGELKAAEGDHVVAFAQYEALMRGFVAGCQGLADSVEWFIPRTRFRQWMGQMIWTLLPHTPWKNAMTEMPIKIGNSVELRDYATAAPGLS